MKWTRLFVGCLIVLVSVVAHLPAYADIRVGESDRGEKVYEQHILELRRWHQYSEEQKKLMLKKANKEFRACIEGSMTAADKERCSKAPTLVTCAEDRGCRVVDPREVAREVIAELRFPDATPVFGPDPEVNKAAPGKLAVGFPYWLTVPGDVSRSTSATSQGLTLRMDARRTKVVYDMGDGTELTCTDTRAWPGARNGFDRSGKPQRSPVCGHVYTRTGQMVIRATVHWEVTWHGGGLSGVVGLEFTDQLALDVVELHTVVR